MTVISLCICAGQLPRASLGQFAGAMRMLPRGIAISFLPLPRRRPGIPFFAAEARSLRLRRHFSAAGAPDIARGAAPEIPAAAPISGGERLALRARSAPVARRRFAPGSRGEPIATAKATPVLANRALRGRAAMLAQRRLERPGDSWRGNTAAQLRDLRLAVPPPVQVCRRSRPPSRTWSERVHSAPGHSRRLPQQLRPRRQRAFLVIFW